MPWLQPFPRSKQIKYVPLQMSNTYAMKLGCKQVYLALASVLANSALDPHRVLAEAELEAAALAGSDANKGLAAKAAATVARSSKLSNILTTGFSSSSGPKAAKGASVADDSVAPAQSSVVGR